MWFNTGTITETRQTGVVQGVAKYSLKSLLVLTSNATCFDDTVSESLMKVLDAVSGVVTDTAVCSDDQQQRLQLCALQVCR